MGLKINIQRRNNAPADGIGGPKTSHLSQNMWSHRERKRVYKYLNILKNSAQYLFIILIFLTILSSIALSVENKYIGSKESNKYHAYNCRWAKNIKKENIVEFKTIEEAINAGYEPCGTCKPKTNEPLKKKKK